MQPTKKASPTSILHEELLWNIFLEITNDALVYPWQIEHRPIVVIRCCSHVCGRWRSVILSSSTIWGRLIDLDYFHKQKTDEWMKEVVSRTGSALLWVYGRVGHYQDARNHFLSTFLQENWRRIQGLVVSDGLFWPLEQRKKMWAFLHKPAPRLRWADLMMDIYYMDEFLPRLLFADNAPLLTDFRIRNEYKFSTDASWISNLCDVTFTDVFHPSEVLEALQRMPRLEYVQVYIGRGAADYRGPMIILPRLRMLQFQARSFLDAGTFLQRIAPSGADCCLFAAVYLVELMPFPDNGEYLNEYEAVIAKHFIPYSSLHLPSVVTFAVTDDIFTLGYGGQGFVPGHPAAPQRRVHYLTLHTPSLPSSLLMEKFHSSGWFSQVTELDFGTWYFSFDFNRLEIVPTLSSFSSLKTFSTNDVILHALLRLPSSLTATLFPVLITLRMSNPNTPQPRTDSEEPPHHRFLQFRKVIGRPLSVFEISFPKPHMDKESPSYNMEYLEVHSGLLFRWKIAGEGTEQYRCYRCGDGHPERLRFNLANPFTIS